MPISPFLPCRSKRAARLPRLLRFALALLVFLAPLVGGAQITSGTRLPSNDEQYTLQLINQARASANGLAILQGLVTNNLSTITPSTTRNSQDGTAWTVNFWTSNIQGVAYAMNFYHVHPGDLKRQYLDLVIPNYPLAWHPNLGNVASGYNAIVIASGGNGTGFPHNLAPYAADSTFAQFAQRYTDGGYGPLNDLSALAENIAPNNLSDPLARFAAFMIDWGSTADGIQDQNPATGSHRLTIMSSQFTETGISALSGWSSGDTTEDQEFGTRFSTHVRLTGVVYRDLDSNGFYTSGEGQAGVTVTATPQAGGQATQTTTYGSGGYALELNTPGTYTITASGAFGTFNAGSVTIGTKNVSLNMAVTATAETVSAPTVPSGATSGTAGTSYAYSTGGSVSNLGSAVQYFFDWGDGTNSGWLAIGTTSAAKIWTAAGTYTVKAQARSATSISVVSAFSSTLSVNMAAGASGPARMSTPVPGTTLAGASATFTWTPGAGATGYGLYLGSSAGGYDLFNSGLLTSNVLTQTATSLPTDGRTIFARVWTVVNGVLSCTDSTYIAFSAGAPTRAQMVTPAAGATLAGATATFTWSTGTGATGYGLYLGSSAGGYDLFNSGLLASNVLTQTATGLPTNGRTIFARLWTVVNGILSYNDTTYTAFSASAQTQAQMVTPAPGATLSSSSATFTWNAGNGSTGYRLSVGTTAGGSDVFNGSTLASNVLTQNVTGLPTNGHTLYVRLWSQLSGNWVYTDLTYTASTAVAETISTPTTPSGPASGTAGTSYAYSTGGAVSNLGHGVQYFLDWGDGTNSGWLAVGTTSASKIWSTSGAYTVKAQARSATTTTVVSAFSTGLVVNMAAVSGGPAHMSTPAPGATLTSSPATFTWTAATGGTGYCVFVGNTPGGSDLFNGGILAANVLTQSASGLPTDGRTLYVRLWSQVSGNWIYVDYTYTALTATVTASDPTKGQMASPANGATLTSSTVAFTWTAGTASTGYCLFVGNTPGASDIYGGSILLGIARSVTVNGVPIDGRTVYVRLWSQVAGNWVYNDYTYK